MAGDDRAAVLWATNRDAAGWAEVGTGPEATRYWPSNDWLRDAGARIQRKRRK
jgi:hypothetical protein